MNSARPDGAALRARMDGGSPAHTGGGGRPGAGLAIRSARPRASRRETLTAREREIAALAARGYGTREIEAALVISTGTVRTHVERILKKLHLHSRLQLSAWALRHLPEARRE